MPVRIVAHSFGPDRPARDLYLSPQHSVAITCLEEVLIPVKHLINGGTVAQVSCDQVAYYHVELDEHDVILAENLPCESFLDTQGRVGFFDNGAEHAAAHPDLPLKSMDDFCRPLVQEGPIVAAVRTQLQRRMKAIGWAITHDADLHLLADGRRLDADMTGDAVRFTVPSGTRDLRIRSKSFVPREIEADSGDGRRLGVPLRGLMMSDGISEARAIAIDDGCLVDGFSFVQSDSALIWRWTDGEAVLPASLWEGVRGSFFLRLDLASERGNYREWSHLHDAVTATSKPDNVLRFRKAG